MLLIDQEAASNAIPALLPTDLEGGRALAIVREVIASCGNPSANTDASMQRIVQLFEDTALKTAPAGSASEGTQRPAA